MLIKTSYIFYKFTLLTISLNSNILYLLILMDKYNIEGYPTIKLLKDGQVIEYDAKPSKDTLNQFLNTVL